MKAIHSRLAQFLLSLELCQPAEEYDSIVNEIIETGGVWPDIDLKADAVFEIQLHGAIGIGIDAHDAIASWKRQALKVCPLTEEALHG